MKRVYIGVTLLAGFIFLGLSFYYKCIPSELLEQNEANSIKRSLKSQQARQDLFINKTYSGLPPDNYNIISCSGPDKVNSVSCRLLYRNREELSTNISVHIKIFTDQNAAKIHTMRLIAISNSIYSLYDNGTGIVIYRGENKSISSIRWVSGNKKINISGSQMYLPTEIIKDYMQKHPPTGKFIEDDLDGQKVMKNDLKGRMEKLRKFEAKRLEDDSKDNIYTAMVAQCSYELHMRCQLGFAQKTDFIDCPAAMELDDSKRALLFTELERAIDEREVVMENIVNDNPDHGWCRRNESELAKEMLIKLAPWDEDIERIPSQILPNMSPDSWENFKKNELMK
jgi:hypothetical protein